MGSGYPKNSTFGVAEEDEVRWCHGNQAVDAEYCDLE